jgi:hypothetical protein
VTITVRRSADSGFHYPRLRGARLSVTFRSMEAPLTDGLVGGDTELELVRSALRDVLGGRASTPLMEGEAGTGRATWCGVSSIMLKRAAGRVPWHRRRAVTSINDLGICC